VIQSESKKNKHQHETEAHDEMSPTDFIFTCVYYHDNQCLNLPTEKKLNPIRMRNEIMRETLRKEILLVSEIK
jgi:hypothetical protein